MIGSQSKNSLFMQITNACNLDCSFCSEGEKCLLKPKLMQEDIIVTLIDDFKQIRGKRIVLTGGEPTLYPKLYKIINYALSVGLKVKLDTNATILFKKYQKVTNPAQVQIQCSLEGRREQNDHIRGEGVFVKAKETLRQYTKEGFDCCIKLTLAPTTCSKDIETLAGVSSELGLSKLKLGIIKYFGKAKDKSFQFETKKFVDLLKCVPSIQRRYRIKIELCDYVPFLPILKNHYSKACKGINNYFIFIDGTVVPCRFLDDVVLGNIKKESLIDIFRRGSILDAWEPPKECEECIYLNYCGGGCRYRALKYKDLNSCDPACFRSCKGSYLPL